MLTLSELAVAVVFVTASDGLTVTDAGDLNQFGATDTASLTESAATTTAVLTANDAVVVIDVGTSPETPTESKSGSDTIYLGHNYPNPDATESLTVADAGTVSAATASTLVRDTFTVSEAGSVTEVPVAGISKSDSEALTLTETNNSVTTGSDGPEITLSEVGVVTVGPTVSESLSLGEATVLAIGQNQNPNDSDSLSVSDTGSVTTTAAAADSATVVEGTAIVSEGGAFFLDVSDAFGLAEASPATASLLVGADLSFATLSESSSWDALVGDTETFTNAEQPVAIAAVSTLADTFTLGEFGTRSDYLGTAVGTVTLRPRTLGTAAIIERLLGEVHLDG